MLYGGKPRLGILVFDLVIGPDKEHYTLLKESSHKRRNWR